MGYYFAIITVFVGLFCAGAAELEFSFSHTPACHIPSPEDFEAGCGPGNSCVKPCYNQFLPTQRPTFYFQGLPAEEDVWIEVLSLLHPPTLCNGELLEVFHPEKRRFGSFSITPITNEGMYIVAVFQGRRAESGVLSIQKFCITKF
ncbi:putative transmembrane protein [Toxoplasma gondii TgCatPRC2]|uniref:Transmembrane protein n=15 Tax=Toxoplasma gondii TaxID=5811 RepID=A0A125YGQ3_TOXGG|nr:hypothetical protein TGME49_205450 [Toxoplasma gondii ME49]EPR61439.1 hypothetical protein TGGT1_205450 [Toxoplasma gondii GT1]ESS33218.1 putative transmembrane protein [Toxoplasma gondii VEG]KAF4642680.1 hypothetical protein TGRH88_034060 [Toxoplasma gondii]KFG33656.1 putative transmembrane protein [Toxoplasma gondii p89]KFG36823.1 putative transmembrane protein [Toxoplasma gondii FOU]KFG38221.1 putative transmembrane protein [Toxoplasma gondii GAB2-2007-GAL-DOM2]KFG59143.1 putative tran|eukprot:XP_002367776.1 hypothetical protein TGME49_205450 [Toxoplasma gondii ME49]